MMRYWRYYPRFLQLLLLLLLMFTLTSFSSLLAAYLIGPLFGVSVDQVVSVSIDSPKALISAMQFLQGISSLFMFLVSALLFAYLTHPKPIPYLGLQKKLSFLYLILVPLAMIMLMPMVNQLGDWIQQLDLGQGLKLQHQKSEDLMKALMSGTSVSDLAINLLIFALLPAIGEELLFRGVVMRFSYQNSKNIHFAILMSAAIFSLAHGSIYNFLPILIMGVFLGYLYYFSGSLWASMLAHFVNNALGVVAVYLVNNKIIAEENAEHFPWYGIVISLIIFGGVIRLMYVKATFLPTDWSDDFKGEAATQ